MPRLILAGVLALAGCTAVAPSKPLLPREEAPASVPPIVADPPGWRRVQASGRYTVAVPPTLERRYRQGIDSAVDQFVGEGVQLDLDYGLYGGSFSPSEPGLRIDRLPGDGRPLGWSLRPADADGEVRFRWTFTARMSDPPQPLDVGPNPPAPGPGLTLSMHCRTAELCEPGRTIARSVRFGSGVPLAERVVFLRRSAPGGVGPDRMQGPMVVDSNGCLRLTDNEGVPGPVLVWPAGASLDQDRGAPAVVGGEGRPLRVEGDYAFVTGRRIAQVGDVGVTGRSEMCVGPAFAVSAFSSSAPVR